MSLLLKQLVHRRQYRQRYAMLEQLLKHERMSQQQLLEKQQQDFQAIVSYATEHSHFYQQKYAALSGNESIHINITDLPILRKEEVITNRDQMLTLTDKSTVRLGHTGGSTGKPLAFWYDTYKMELMRAGMYRSYMWSGWQPGEKILNFWGAKQDFKQRGLAKKWHDLIAAEQTIGAWEYTDKQLQQWADHIRSWRPVLLQGYASILAELATFINHRSLSMPKSIKGVYSTAEILYDWQREAIEKAFGCTVYNQYGSREIPNIGLQCRHGNYHTFTDMVYLESIEELAEKKFIISSLTNQTMPFIRYDIGDSGRLKAGECSCGSPFPMIEMGFCRSNDIITLANNQKIYPSWFIHLLDGVDGINQYQFVQTKPEQMVLYLDAEKPLSPQQQEMIQQRVQDKFADQLCLTMQMTDQISRTSSGKRRFVISL